jgi:hypothetical protein
MRREHPSGRHVGDNAPLLSRRRRCLRPAIMVETMAQMVVSVIEGSERAGITVNCDALSSPYDALVGLEDL